MNDEDIESYDLWNADSVSAITHYVIIIQIIEICLKITGFMNDVKWVYIFVPTYMGFFSIALTEFFSLILMIYFYKKSNKDEME